MTDHRQHDEGDRPRALRPARRARAPRRSTSRSSRTIRCWSACTRLPSIPVEWYGVTGPYFARHRERAAQAQEHDRGRRPGRRSKPSARTSRSSSRVTRCSARQPAPGPSTRSPARDARAEAGQRFVRGSGRRSRCGDHRPPGAARQGRGPARAEGSDQRRVRRCRHLRRAAREGVRRGRDRRLQHAERGAGPIARRRPRRRLHAGGLHEARRASRPDARHRRQPLVPGVQTRIDSRGDRRAGRRTDDLSRARASAPPRRNDAEVDAAGARR